MLTLKHAVFTEPEEAYRKLAYLQTRLWHEQYAVNFIVQDLRPEVILKNEIQAFWEGRIGEIHGWANIIDQIVSAITEAVKEPLEWLWNTYVKPALETVLTWLKENIPELYNILISAYQIARNVWNTLTEGVSWLTTTLWQIILNIWNTVLTFSTQALSTINSAVKQIQEAIRKYAEETYRNFDKRFKEFDETSRRYRDEIVKKQVEVQSALATTIHQAVQPIVEAVQDPLKFILDSLKELGVGASEALTWIGQEAVSKIQSGLEWVAEWIREQTTSFIMTIFAHLQHVSARIKAGDWSAAFEVFGLAALIGAATASMISALGTKVLGTGVEVGEIGNYLNRLISIEMFTSVTLGVLLASAVETPFKQLVNSQFTPNIPTISDAYQFLWRGHITEEELREIIRKWGYGGKYAEAYFDLRKKIPGASDLIRFVVRECFPLEQLPPAPPEFVKYMAKQGYDELWSRAYWHAHWELPSFENLREAFWRGIISLQEFRQYIIWHDYAPFPRPGISKSDVDIMNELSYKLPGKIDARWMLRWGIITREEHEKLIKMEGMHPEWIKKVAEAEYMNMLLDERTGVKSAVEQVYREGYWVKEAVLETLKSVRFLEDEIKLLIQRADILREREVADMYISALKSAFRQGKITKEEFIAKASKYVKDKEHLLKLIEAEEIRYGLGQQMSMEEEVRATGRSTVIRRFKEGIITDVELEEELRLLGYSDAQIQRFKILAYLERDYDIAMTVLSAVKSAYLKKKIGDETFINLLRQYGFTDERILLELQLLKLKMGLLGPEVGE